MTLRVRVSSWDEAKVYSGYRFNMNVTFRISDLAKQSGVKVVTIRYYEQSSFLPSCQRTAGNYRVYGEEHLQRLNFVRRCRKLGFSLEQIRDLLLLSASQAPTCADVCNIATDHLKEVEFKISDLKRLASELRRIGFSCNGKQSISGCRRIASLTHAYANA
jgi:DNA-binding transcriptional MerR regulator